MVSNRGLYIKNLLGSGDRLHEIRKARQRLQRGVRVVLHQGTDGIGQLIKRCCQEVRQLIFQVAPQPFNRIEFWTLGWQEDRHSVGWPAQGFRFVEGAII